MGAVIQSINLIASDPNLRGGRPCVAGTGLRVIDVVMAHLFHQRSPSEIASDYAISLAQVHAALAYYYDHRAEIDEREAADLTTAEAIKQQYPSKLQTKLSQRG